MKNAWNNHQNRKAMLTELVSCLRVIADDITEILEENEQMSKTMKHSDAKQDKKLINKIVDKKLARATRADKRQDAKMLKRVVKKPSR